MKEEQLENKNKLPIFLINLRKIKKWMQINNTTRTPRTDGENLSKEEKKLGKAYSYIKRKVRDSYRNLKSAEEIENFEKQNPEIKEAKEFIQWVEENRTYVHLENARKIQAWMIRNNKVNPPKAKGTNLGEEERKLGTALDRIKQNLIKKYEELQTKKEKDEFKCKHPELDEVIKIVKWIEKENIPTYLRNAREIQAWMTKNNTTRPPRANGSNVSEEEKRLGQALSKIRKNLVKKYKELKSQEEINEFRKQHPNLDEVIEIVDSIDSNNIPIYLQYIREIKTWMIKNNTTRPPRKEGKNLSKEEKELGMKLARIRNSFIKVYENLKSEKERKDFRKKHPEIEEILNIVKWIDKNNVSQYLRNTLEIEQWIEDTDSNKPPSMKKTASKRERRLAKNLANIRSVLIKPYKSLNTKEERKAFKQKYPDIEYIVKIIEWIDKETSKKVHLNDNENKGKKSKNGNFNKAINTLETTILRPYMRLKTEREREEYLKSHPDLEYIVTMYEEIINNSNEAKLKKAKQKRNNANDKKEQANKIQEELKRKLENEKTPEK